MPDIDRAPEMVFYTVRRCKMNLPVTGECSAYRVMRVYASASGPADGPCCAVFIAGRNEIGREMAEKYCEYLMQQRLEVI